MICSEIGQPRVCLEGGEILQNPAVVPYTSDVRHVYDTLVTLYMITAWLCDVYPVVLDFNVLTFGLASVDS